MPIILRRSCIAKRGTVALASADHYLDRRCRHGRGASRGGGRHLSYRRRPSASAEDRSSGSDCCPVMAGHVGFRLADRLTGERRYGVPPSLHHRRARRVVRYSGALQAANARQWSRLGGRRRLLTTPDIGRNGPTVVGAGKRPGCRVWLRAMLGMHRLTDSGGGRGGLGSFQLLNTVKQRAEIMQSTLPPPSFDVVSELDERAIDWCA